MPPERDLGREFAEALGRNDPSGAAELLHEEVDFRALTPNRSWEASRRSAVRDEVFARWWDEGEEIEELVELESGRASDRIRLCYLLRVRLPEGPTLMEQQAFYEHDGRWITWLRVICSGNRPL